jgi:hypothetical protein
MRLSSNLVSTHVNKFGEPSLEVRCLMYFCVSFAYQETVNPPEANLLLAQNVKPGKLDAAGKAVTKGPKGSKSTVLDFRALLKDPSQPAAANDTAKESSTGIQTDFSSDMVYKECLFTDYQLKQLRAQCFVFQFLRFVFFGSYFCSTKLVQWLFRSGESAPFIDQLLGFRAGM